MDITQNEINELKNGRWQAELQRHRDLTLKQYKKSKGNLPEKYQAILEQAIKQRYLVMPSRSSTYASTIRYTFKLWCGAHGQPTLVVWPADRYKASNVQMYLDLDSLEHLYNFYAPELDKDDETFHLMLLLCNEWSWSQGHVHLRYVNIERFDDVAQQLLAYYDRCYQKRLEHLKPFLK